MPLHFAESILFNAVSFRVVHLWGRFGGGKTALAHYLAYQLMLRFKFRYILSNIVSVWRDDPADVFLADGKTVDAVLILDEAGVFMKSATETEQWLSALRKLNIVILCPSFQPPSRTARMLVLQRVFDARIIGLPFWWYKWTLDMGALNENGNFYWRNPQEIFGIFDTEGYPTEADELLGYVQKWVAEAQINMGYASAPDTRTDQSAAAGKPPEEAVGLSAGAASDAPKATRYTTPAYVADVSRVADDIEAAAIKAEKALSLRRGRSRR